MEAIDELFFEVAAFFKLFFEIKLALQVHQFVRCFKQSYNNYNLHQSLFSMRNYVLDILNQLKIPKEKNVSDLKKSSSSRIGNGRISFI